MGTIGKREDRGPQIGLCRGALSAGSSCCSLLGQAALLLPAASPPPRGAAAAVTAILSLMVQGDLRTWGKGHCFSFLFFLSHSEIQLQSCRWLSFSHTVSPNPSLRQCPLLAPSFPPTHPILPLRRHYSLSRQRSFCRWWQ